MTVYLLYDLSTILQVYKVKRVGMTNLRSVIMTMFYLTNIY